MEISPDNSNGIADINSDFGFINDVLSGVENGAYRDRRVDEVRRLSQCCSFEDDSKELP